MKKILVFAGWLFAMSAVAQGVDLYICAGQSNMVGVPAGQTPVQNPNSIWAETHEGNWVQARDPLYRGGGVGPGVSFADTMVGLSGHQVGLVPCAVSGSSMAQWLPDYSTYTLYGCMMARIHIAQQYGTIKGLIWYQGEAETMDRNNVVLYSQRVHTLFNAIREDLNMSNLPIIFVQIGPDPHQPAYWCWSAVQAWQQTIANAHPPGIEMVSAKDLQAIPGNPYHLDLHSQIVLGRRIAEAMYQILP